MWLTNSLITYLHLQTKNRFKYQTAADEYIQPLLKNGKLDVYIVSIKKYIGRDFIPKKMTDLDAYTRDVYTTEGQWELASQPECQCRSAQQYWSCKDWHLHHSWSITNISGHILAQF